MQGICNKFIKVKFWVEFMVSQPNRLLDHQLPCLLLIRFYSGNGFLKIEMAFETL